MKKQIIHYGIYKEHPTKADLVTVSACGKKRCTNGNTVWFSI